MKPELKLVEDTGSELITEFEPPPQQAEMPFAMVDGEPMTEMPRDLYIPPDALQVFLEAFEGPLDLLLYLIRRQNLDILDIPIAEITKQYMKYIDVMAEMQLELAGEYLLMAAMLAEIKSRMLLPRVKTEDGLEESDPRAELVRRLQEYERFKKAAEDIDKLQRMERDTVAASAELVERKIVKIVPEVTLQEMLLAFRDVVARSNMFAHHHVQRERLSVRQRMSDILGTLKQNAWVEFVRLFQPEEGRMGVSVTFVAVLELMREGLIEIVQAEVYGPLHVRPASGGKHLSVVTVDAANDGDLSITADQENIEALSQPAQPDENQEWDPDLDAPDVSAVVESPAEIVDANALLQVESELDVVAPVTESQAVNAAAETAAIDADVVAADATVDSQDDSRNDTAIDASNETQIDSEIDSETPSEAPKASGESATDSRVEQDL
jgi:segregation and condensation protein A